MLLTNGCSFVWGDELQGYDKSPPEHYHLTFTHHLSNKLKTEYVNLATCGACNDKIFRDTIDYLLDPTKENPTHMVILWSAWQRDEAAENRVSGWEREVGIQRFQCMSQFSPARMHHIKPELEEVLSPALEKMDVLRTKITHHLSFMKSMELICDSLGIKLIQGSFHKRCWSNILLSTHPRFKRTDSPWTEWIEYTHKSLSSLKDTSRLGLGRYIDFYTFAENDFKILEYGHPNEPAHEAWSQYLYDIFVKEFS